MRPGVGFRITPTNKLLEFRNGWASSTSAVFPASCRQLLVRVQVGEKPLFTGVREGTYDEIPLNGVLRSSHKTGAMLQTFLFAP